MDKSKKELLEQHGWKVGTVDELLDNTCHDNKCHTCTNYTETNNNYLHEVCRVYPVKSASCSICKSITACGGYDPTIK